MFNPGVDHLTLTNPPSELAPSGGVEMVEDFLDGNEVLPFHGPIDGKHGNGDTSR